MKGTEWQFGKSEMGGMANVLKVRETLSSYADPGPYVFPEGTVPWPATMEELERDGIFPLQTEDGNS